MATEFFNEDTDEQAAEGGKLRKELEKALAALKKTQAELVPLKVQAFLGGKQLDLVKPEDLANVDPNEWESKAAEVQTERQTQQTELLRGALVRLGHDEESIEAMVAGVAPPAADTADQDATARIRQAGRLAAAPPPAVDVSKLHGLDAIKAGLTTSKK